MEAFKECKRKEISKVLSLLNVRQDILKEQEAINLESYEIDIKIKRLRDYYGLQIEALKKRLEAGDYSAVQELQSVFEEFREAFIKQYYRQLKLRRKSENIQDEIFKIADEIINL